MIVKLVYAVRISVSRRVWITGTRAVIGCTVAILYLLISSRARADSRSAEHLPSAEAIYGAMCASIESVSRGIVHVEDSIWRAAYRTPGKTSYRVVFDNSRNMLRCDRVHRDRDGRCRRTKYARTPTESLFQLLREDNGAAGIDVGSPDRDLSSSLDQPLDAHLLWFASAGGYLRREDYSAAKRNFLLRAPTTEVSEDRAGRLVLRWKKLVDNNTSENIRTLTVDPGSGFVPVRNEAATKSVGSSEAIPAGWSEIRYAKKNGCLVPVSLEIHGDGGLTIKVSCDWQSVNQEIDPKTFTVEGFDASKGTSVWDLRGPEPVLLGVNAPVVPRPAAGMRLVSWRSPVMLLLVGNVFVLALLAVCFVARRLWAGNRDVG